ncbi:MAG TPA: DUF1707 domain-containing protein [Nocardioidaceae bacterium]|nr:DUF1707 domain-containing protein [Nocardioidaceae bacterium]
MPDQRPDPRRDLRVSHDDRDRVAEMLRDAAGEGRLDMDELEQRLEQAFTAKTYRNLEPLVADLPGTRRTQSVSSGVGGVPTTTRSQAILSEHKRNGVWVVPAAYTATAILGSVEIDLREASFAEPEVVVSCVSLLGEIKIRVGADVVVVDEVNTVLGECSIKSSKGLAPMPQHGRVLRVRGTAFLGSVTIERLAPEDRRLRRFWE